MPADFASIAPTLSHFQIMRHYGCGDTVAKRWYGEAAVRPKPFVPRLMAPQPQATPQRDHTLAGRAAHHLRKYFPNVYRADVLPARERVGMPTDGFVVAGKGVLMTTELVALAEQYGFVG